MFTRLALAASILVCAGLGDANQQGHPHPIPGHTGFQIAIGQTVLDLSVENRGDVYIELETKRAPKAAGHVEALAKEGFYDGQRFFKVLNSPRPYLVQTGDPQSKTESVNFDSLGGGGSGTKIEYENSHLSYSAGSVVLATMDGNRDSGDSQFYILLGDYNRLLDGTATVFGRVIYGLDVVQHIELGDRIASAKILNG